MSFARHFLILLVFSFLVFLTGCVWFGGDAAPVFPTATITGALKTDGAMPSEVLNLMKAGSARTVVPSALGSGTVTYACEIKTADNTVVQATSYNFATESDGSGNVYYTITGLPLTASPQTLKLTITLKVAGNEVLRCAEQELADLSLTQPAFQRDIVLRPISEGSGSYSLTVNLDSSINISTETYKLYLYLYDPADPTNTSKIKDEYKQLTSNSWGWSGVMPSGTYKAIISLYKVVSSVEYLVYQFEEIVNIFQNLATNTWLKHSAAQEYIDDSVTPAICKITAGCISNFLSTNIYVDSSTTVDAASQTGSYLAPFSDIRNAFYYIRNVSTSDSTTTYTIQVKGGSSFTFSSGIAINRNIVIKCWATTPGDNLGSATILADSSSFTGSVIFNISDGKKFTAHHGLIIDGNNKSVVGVQVSDGIFEMCGGGNKIRNCNIGLALSEKTSTNTVAANLTSGMITSNKKGVEVTSSNTLNVSGVITIDGNVNTSSQKNNVYLPDGITFNVNGELTNGANICVSTATAATLATNVSIATGYNTYHTTPSSNPPGKYIHSDLGDPIIFNGTNNTVEIAKNGGSIKNSYDIKFSFTSSSKLMEPGTAKAITITPTVTTKNASDTTIPLFYNPADQKLYTEGTFTTLYLPDIEASPDYNKVTWNAALYNSGVLVTGYQPSVATDDPANKFTVPALPAEKYNLKITATYLGVKYDVGYNLNISKPLINIPSASTTGNSGSVISNVFISGRSLSLPAIIACDHEVTQSEYEKYCIYQRALSEDEGIGPDYPAYWVSWYDAIVYCNLRTITEMGIDNCVYELPGHGKNPANWDPLYETVNGVTKYGGPTGPDSTWDGITADITKTGWRLPTNAEWEYLARGGNLTSANQTTYSGSNTINDVGWYQDNSSSIVHPVKEKKPNALGLYDMTGNLDEWCWDWEGSITTGTDIMGADSGSFRVYRGGAWNRAETDLDFVGCTGAWGASNGTGFRVVRTVE